MRAFTLGDWSSGKERDTENPSLSSVQSAPVSESNRAQMSISGFGVVLGRTGGTRGIELLLNACKADYAWKAYLMHRTAMECIEGLFNPALRQTDI